MAGSNDKSNKSVRELAEYYLEKLHTIDSDYESSTSKNRDNLLGFIETSKKNILNAETYCESKIAEISEKMSKIPEKLAKENEEILVKHEERIKINNKSLDDFTEKYQNVINEINEIYDKFVVEGNDELIRLHNANNTDYETYISSLTDEEEAQKKEFNQSIAEIIDEIDSQSKMLELMIDNLKHEFLMKTASYNNQMKEIKSEYVSQETLLKQESKNKISSFTRQIEKATEDFCIKQNSINSQFKAEMASCNALDDELISKFHDDDIVLLQKQTENRISKLVFEINKKRQIDSEKALQDYIIHGIRIERTDYDSEHNYLRNKYYTQSLINIAEYENQLRLIDVEKDNAIDMMSLEANLGIRKHQLLLDNKKRSLNFFLERFEILRETKERIKELNSQHNDIKIMLMLDQNQFERENQLENAKATLKKKQEDIHTANLIAELEYDKELESAEIKSRIETIEHEIEKLNAKYDNVIFKTRAEYNIEKARIEHILQMFEIKYQKEVFTLKNDINFLISLATKIKEEMAQTSSTYVENIRNNKSDPSEVINSFSNMFIAEISSLNDILERYFEDLDLRTTPDVDEIIDEYLLSTSTKKQIIQSDYNDLIAKNNAIEKELEDITNDIIYLEASKKTLTDKLKKDISNSYSYTSKIEIKKSYDVEIEEINDQINGKEFREKILRMRLKAQAKDLASYEAEISRMDEGEKIFSKKESQKLFDLKLDNNYFDRFDEIKDKIDDFFKELHDSFEQCLSKKNNIKSLYILISDVIKKSNKFISYVKTFSNVTYNMYKEQFKKINRVFLANLDKEKKTLEMNITSINNEKVIEIEEANSKILLAQRTIRENELKLNYDKNNAKLFSNETKRNIDLALEEYSRKFDISKYALASNVTAMEEYYDKAIKECNKNLNNRLDEIFKMRFDDKRNYELALSKMDDTYRSEKSKHIISCKHKVEDVRKINFDRLYNLTVELKENEELRKKALKEKASLLKDSKIQFEDTKKQIELDKVNEINKKKNEINHKLKRELKHLKK